MDLLIEDKIRKICKEIMNNYKEEAYNIIKEAFSLMVKLLMNIARQTNEEKFRTFKKSNQAIKTKILIIKEKGNMKEEKCNKL
jgi:hypothetical protein